jgi:type II secretory pathway component PulK
MMNKKGAALLLALFSLIVVSMLVAAFLEAVTIDLQIVNNLELRNKALYIADAGVEYAIYQLKSNKNWSGTGGAVNFPNSNSNYNVTYSNVSGKITSIGSLNSGEQVTLEIKVSVTGSLPYQVKIIYWREL